MEQLPHGDAARHALVSRLLTKHLYQVTPSYRSDTKYSSWKYLGVRMGNPQWVDEIVFPQSKQENVVLEEACMSQSQVGAYCGQGREGKEKQQGKVTLG